MVVILTIFRLQGPMAWLGGVLIGACLLAAVRFWRESKLPVYLQNATPILDVWEITPGEGIGPLRLGPPDHAVIRLLRKNVGLVQQGPIVTCLLRHADGWTTVVASTAKTAPGDRGPDPMEFESIEWVMTTCPAHLTLGGVRVGSALPDVAAAQGAPSEVWKPLRSRHSLLRWQAGLEAGLDRNRVVRFSVFAHKGGENDATAGHFRSASESQSKPPALDTLGRFFTGLSL